MNLNHGPLRPEATARPLNHCNCPDQKPVPSIYVLCILIGCCLKKWQPIRKLPNEISVKYSRIFFIGSDPGAPSINLNVFESNVAFTNSFIFVYFQLTEQRFDEIQTWTVAKEANIVAT